MADAEARRLEVNYQRSTGQQVRLIRLDAWQHLIKPQLRNLLENYQAHVTENLRGRQDMWRFRNCITALDALYCLGWEPTCANETFVVSELAKVQVCVSGWRCSGEVVRWRCAEHKHLGPP